MVIGFNKQFVYKIKQGQKIHTIRMDEHNRWKKSMTMHMATGVRTKKYKCFKKGKCIGIQRIKIRHRKNYTIDVIVDNKKLSVHGVLLLAKNDGFPSIIHFLNWFHEYFTGKILHWTYYRY